MSNPNAWENSESLNLPRRRPCQIPDPRASRAGPKSQNLYHGKKLAGLKIDRRITIGFKYGLVCMINYKYENFTNDAFISVNVIFQWLYNA